MPIVKPAVVQSVSVFSLEIPFRGSVAHAASVRRVSDAVVVEVRLQGDRAGYGETLPRPYVTGESVASVLETIETVLVPWLISFRAENFPAALESLQDLPWVDLAGKRAPAARAAVELALLEACCRHFGREPDDVARWSGLPGMGLPGSLRRIRFTGVLASETPEGTRRNLRRMYWLGMRNFKLKVGFDGDTDRLREVCAYLGKGLRSGRTTLRLDANGAWDLEQAARWIADTESLPYYAVEQPLPPSADEQLPELKSRVAKALIHDESLTGREDAERLVRLGVADGFNIRISKCGGWLASLDLAAYARSHGTAIILGCMVGETSILSAAALRLMSVVPEIRQAEGCFGSFLLSRDVVRRPLRFGIGGQPPRRGRRYAEFDLEREAVAQLATDIRTYPF